MKEMIIKRAKKEDLKEYLRLRKETLKKYYKTKKESTLISDRKIKNEFNNLLKSSKHLLLIVREDKKILGYLIGSLLKNVFGKTGYLDDIFISKDSRGKGIGNNLIKKFIEILNKKGVKKFRLGVDIQNKNAINFYKKLGFKITQYEMSKKCRK